MSTPNLRERKRRLMQAEITAIALRLFRERGYSETTVDDLAAASGMSRRTFFRYFPSK
ncbi:TetR family transcriptional regulator, partial [Burkholderia multivorans]